MKKDPPQVLHTDGPPFGRGTCGARRLNAPTTRVARLAGLLLRTPHSGSPRFLDDDVSLTAACAG
jgi:hypothetical protein